MLISRIFRIERSGILGKVVAQAGCEQCGLNAMPPVATICEKCGLNSGNIMCFHPSNGQKTVASGAVFDVFLRWSLDGNSGEVVPSWVAKVWLQRAYFTGIKVGANSVAQRHKSAKAASVALYVPFTDSSSHKATRLRFDMVWDTAGIGSSGKFRSKRDLELPCRAVPSARQWRLPNSQRFKCEQRYETMIARGKRQFDRDWRKVAR